MNAGSHDRQITIQKKVTTQDPTYGTELITWAPLVPLPGSPVIGERFWAQVVDALPSRAESVVQGLTVARNQVRIRFRYYPGVTSDMRVLLHGDGDDEVLEIVGGPAMIDGRKVRIEIMCERIAT